MFWKRDPHSHKDNNTHDHSEQGRHHTHGVIDPSIAASDRGVWATKWSFVGLMATALLQAVVVFVSGSVALMADTIHELFRM